MAESFTTVYDIQATGGVSPYSPDEINAWIFGLAFASILLLVLCVATWRKNKKRLIAIPIIASVVAFYLTLDYLDRRETAASLAGGKMQSAEGCIANFVTNSGDFYSSKSSKQDEEWDVQGRHFSYKVTSNAPGYHLREARGGVVHDHQYLRVGYLVSPILHRQEIMKIEVGPQRCR